MKQYEFISICFLVWGELLQSTFFFGGGVKGVNLPRISKAPFFSYWRQASEGQSFLFGSALGEFVGQT